MNILSQITFLMASSKKKYYVVWEGNRPGIYLTWNECREQISGYPGARYKAFKTLEAAEEAYTSSFADFISEGQSKRKVKPETPLPPEVILNSWSVDAACSGNPGELEYRGVVTQSGEEIFRVGPYQQGTNNIGEFLAIVHALALLKKQNDDKTPLYSDSRTAILWVKKKKANTQLKKTSRNRKIFNLIDRATDWLEKYPYKNQIYKWDTKNWGEIPADFGRK